MAWDIHQIGDLAKRFDRAPAQCAGLTSAAIERAAQKVYRKAYAEAPRGETGKLRESIKIRPLGPFAAEVAAEIYYASFVEYGTTRRQPEPYMIPAAQDADRDLAGEITKAATEPLR